MSKPNINSFTKEQQEKTLKWLSEKWKNGMQCEVCGEKNWSLNGHLTTPIVFQQGGFTFGEAAYPSLGVVCTNCGNTKHFNAIKMGLVEVAKKEGE